MGVAKYHAALINGGAASMAGRPTSCRRLDTTAKADQVKSKYRMPVVVAAIRQELSVIAGGVSVPSR